MYILSMRKAFRGSILHFLDDPGDEGRESSFEFHEDGVLAVEDGHISKVGSASELLPGLEGAPVEDCRGRLIVPGFVDAHVHFVQTDIIASHGRRLLEVATVPMRTFSATGAAADWRAEDVSLGPAGATFTVVTPDGERIDAGVPLTGEFNVTNALCAIALAGEAGLPPAAVAAGITSSPGVPGRLERIDAGQDFLAVVDYAHKPDAVTAVLEALRPRTTGRLLIVLGAGGDRDQGKRPIMGEIASRLADVLVP